MSTEEMIREALRAGVPKIIPKALEAYQVVNTLYEMFKKPTFSDADKKLFADRFVTAVEQLGYTQEDFLPIQERIANAQENTAAAQSDAAASQREMATALEHIADALQRRAHAEERSAATRERILSYVDQAMALLAIATSWASQAYPMLRTMLDLAALRGMSKDDLDEVRNRLPVQSRND